MALFFLFVVGFGALLTIILSIANFSVDSYDAEMGSFFAYFFATIDIVYDLGIVWLAFYTIKAFFHKRPNAVFLGKSYLVVVSLSNILLLFSGDYTDYGWESLPQILKTLIFGVIWFLYLCLSRQVAELFPKEARKVLKKDKYLVGSLVLIPVFLLFVIFFIYLASSSTFLEVSPQQGEYGDGTIAFHMPANVVCEKTDTLGTVFHSFFVGDSIWGTISSVYDTNTSESYFKECLDSWRDEELDGYDFSVFDIHMGVINRNLMRTQSVKYMTDPCLIWQFATLFSPETGKACLISLYTNTDEAEIFVDSIMNSVRFK
ncbi:hypothetical protein [Bacteroides sp.]|uniref:hypothetical protein n=1 Tax=Bacteroides sp. TaxID=29523 RepID=UPI002603005F|nr:hypothetical protein [Bacteroides sp.]MDD3040701.1 hypothetical protein [Bacteroides sp.]